MHNCVETVKWKKIKFRAKVINLERIKIRSFKLMLPCRLFIIFYFRWIKFRVSRNICTQFFLLYNFKFIIEFFLYSLHQKNIKKKKIIRDTTQSVSINILNAIKNTTTRCIFSMLNNIPTTWLILTLYTRIKKKRN